MIEVLPAIIPKNFRDLEDHIALVAKYADRIQIDVLDGKFLNIRSWPYVGDRGEFQDIIQEKRGLPAWEKINFEIDLMVQNPETVVDDWILAGAESLVIHIESTKNMNALIQNVRARFPIYEITDAGEKKTDIELGIALNIDTPIGDILPYLEEINFVQFMGIAHIGVQGAEFDERAIDKIHTFHNNHPEIKISVDGGVNFDNAKILREIGVSKLVSGSTIFENKNPIDALEDLKNI